MPIEAAVADELFVGPEIVPPLEVVHWYEKFGPLLLPEPSSPTVFIVQVSRLGCAMAEVGSAVFWLMATDPVAVHWFAGFVTVTV